MKRTNLILGMMLLLVAAAAAVLKVDGSRERALAESGSDDGDLSARGANLSSGHLRSESRSRRTTRGFHPVIETLNVEPYASGNPALDAQAQRVEKGAHSRLTELSEGLELSEYQQVAIFPLLARSHPDYSGQLQLVGVPAGLSLIPLGRRAAERQIRRHLDANQRIDHEIMTLEAEAWWTDVIARLEEDLHASTRAPLVSQPPPDDSPSPPQDDQPTPGVPAARPGSHPGSNIKDRLRGGYDR